MATKIKLIMASEFLEVTPEGVIDLNPSRQRLLDVARSDQPPADYELLVDFRDTPYPLSTFEMTELASELCQRGDTFHWKVALLVPPGLHFDQASFFATYALSHSLFVNAFTDCETAMRWMLLVEETPNPIVLAPPAYVNDGSFPRLMDEGWQQ
jgi:hypothetical protein